MGDISAEPSMEEILSSIKRIIAEEGDAAVATRARRPRPAPAPIELDDDEILELREAVSPRPRVEPVADRVRPEPLLTPEPASGTEPEPDRAPEAASVSESARAAEPAQPAEPILSERAAEATRGPLEALSRMIVKPEVSGSDTLEGVVRALLKPMLRDWLDANLPQIVETMVAREIERITSRGG